MGEGIVALLAPFLVIGLVALLVAMMILRARRRSIRRMRATPTPRPEQEWPGAPVEPLVERPVDLDDRWR